MSILDEINEVRKRARNIREFAEGLCELGMCGCYQYGNQCVEIHRDAVTYQFEMRGYKVRIVGEKEASLDKYLEAQGEKIVKDRRGESRVVRIVPEVMNCKNWARQMFCH